MIPPNPAQKVTPYQERVYTLLLQIPVGKISTYSALSRALDSSPRAVGGALRRNPIAPAVPCHRIIGADGVSPLFLSGEAPELSSTDEGDFGSISAASKATGRKRRVGLIVRRSLRC